MIATMLPKRSKRGTMEHFSTKTPSIGQAMAATGRPYDQRSLVWAERTLLVVQNRIKGALIQ